MLEDERLSLDCIYRNKKTKVIIRVLALTSNLL